LTNSKLLKLPNFFHLHYGGDGDFRDYENVNENVYFLNADNRYYHCHGHGHGHGYGYGRGRDYDYELTFLFICCLF
jgi:hypothetical protein